MHGERKKGFRLRFSLGWLIAGFLISSALLGIYIRRPYWNAEAGLNRRFELLQHKTSEMESVWPAVREALVAHPAIREALTDRPEGNAILSVSGGIEFKGDMLHETFSPKSGKLCFIVRLSDGISSRNGWGGVAVFVVMEEGRWTVQTPAQSFTDAVYDDSVLFNGQIPDSTLVDEAFQKSEKTEKEGP